MKCARQTSFRLKNCRLPQTRSAGRLVRCATQKGRSRCLQRGRIDEGDLAGWVAGVLIS